MGKMAKRVYRSPVSIQIYLGSGKEGEVFRSNLIAAAGSDSVSGYIVNLIRKAAPELFKEESNGGKR